MGILAQTPKTLNIQQKQGRIYQSDILSRNMNEVSLGKMRIIKIQIEFQNIPSEYLKGFKCSRSVWFHRFLGIWF